MKVLGNNVLVVPEKAHSDNTGFESEYEIKPQKGEVYLIGEDCQKVKLGDKVIFITMNPIIEEEGWFVIPESDIKVIIND